MNCRSNFATLIDVSPKHAFWIHQLLLQVSKNVDLSFYFVRMGIKRSHSVPSQNYTADDPPNRCFECSKMSRCVRARIVVVKSDLSSAVDFPDFLEGNWQTNGYVWLSDMFSFSEKTGDHLLGSASYASNFCWIWLILKHPYSLLLFTFRLISVNLGFVTCHDIRNVFRCIATVFLKNLLNTC